MLRLSAWPSVPGRGDVARAGFVLGFVHQHCELGTVALSDPIQVSIGGNTADGRADIYSLGVVLCEMLAGFVPFAGREPFQVLRAHLDEPVPALPSGIPDDGQVIAAHALEKDPASKVCDGKPVRRRHSRNTAAHLISELWTPGCETSQ